LQKSRFYENGQRTRRRLIDTALAFYDEGSGRIPTSLAIIERSGIPKGSMYHHFKGFDSLIQAALQVRYVEMCDHALLSFASIFETATTKDEVERRLRTMCQLTFSPDIGVLRHVYAQMFSYTVTAEQIIDICEYQRTAQDQFSELISAAQVRSLFDKSVDVEHAALALQGLILGPPLDHPASTVTAYAWARTLDSEFTSMFQI